MRFRPRARISRFRRPPFLSARHSGLFCSLGGWRRWQPFRVMSYQSAAMSDGSNRRQSGIYGVEMGGSSWRVAFTCDDASCWSQPLVALLCRLPLQVRPPCNPSCPCRMSLQVPDERWKETLFPSSSPGQEHDHHQRSLPGRPHDWNLKRKREMDSIPFYSLVFESSPCLEMGARHRRLNNPPPKETPGTCIDQCIAALKSPVIWYFGSSLKRRRRKARLHYFRNPMGSCPCFLRYLWSNEQ